MANINEIDRILRLSTKSIDSIAKPYAHLMEIVQRNNRLISDLFLPYESISKQFQLIQGAIAPQFSAIAQLQEVFSRFKQSLPDLALHLQLTSTVYDSLRASALIVPDFLRSIGYNCQQLISASRQMSDSFDSLFSVIKERTVFPDLAPTFLLKPSLSVSTQLKTLRSVGFIESSEDEPLDKRFFDEIEEDWGGTEVLIASVDPSWLLPLKGAEAALKSNNPDKVRHTIASLRELLTAILHRFSPDDQVRTSLPDEKWYHEGKPTRRARLHFILQRKHASTLLLDFLDKDIEATLELFELYQCGTHQIVSNVSPDEVAFVLARSKVLIGELIVNGRSKTS